MAVKPSVLRFSIDLQNYDRPFVVNVKQGSSNTKLIVSILDNGKPYIFEDGVSVVFSQMEGDTQISASCKVEDNQIILKLPEDSTKNAGSYDCDFSFLGSEDTLITPHISLVVHASLMYEYASNAVGSDSFGVLKEAITTALNAGAKAEDAAEQANDISEELTQKKDAGEFNGKSAYEIAKENGFSGSEEAWLKARNPSVDGHTLILPYVELGE